MALGEYDVVGLSEVDVPEAYEEAFVKKWPDRYQFIRGLTGTNEDREDDHLWMAFDTVDFDLVTSQEMKEVGGFVFDDGHHRVPLYVRLRDKANGQEVVFIMNHFARGDKEFRQAHERARSVNGPGLSRSRSWRSETTTWTSFLKHKGVTRRLTSSCATMYGIGSGRTVGRHELVGP